MECLDDCGVGWRLEIEPILRSLDIGIINPCNKPSDYADESPSKVKEIAEARRNKEFQKVRDLFKPIAGIDLRSVHKSDFLIVYIDKDIHMCGTYFEVSWAVQQMKPVLVVCKQGRESIPGFIYGLVPIETHFDNFQDMVSHLRLADEGKVDDRRWHFWDHEKIYGMVDEQISK
jgi:nucleoside 2-deoxyribosyltransferase